jgi:TetR/AcrR family tetracycline transcriptional repressor
MLPCTPYSCQVTSSSTRDSGRDDTGRTRLTRDAVVDRALALVDKSGLESLTMRKLATELGVTPMALYWHFRGKEELFVGLADRLWDEMDLTVDPDAPWTEQISGLLWSLLAVLRAHPAAPQLMMHVKTLELQAGLRATNLALDILRTAGFSPEDASLAASTALWTGIMLVMSEPGIESLDHDERAELQRKKQVILATQPLDKYPRLVECAVAMTMPEDPERHYQFGVDVFIGGLSAIAAAQSSSA